MEYQVRAGELRKRFTVQRADQAQSGTGDITLSWVNESRLWGGINPLAGSESITAEQRVADVTHEVTVRYTESLAPDRRLVLGSRIFEIVSVLNVDERNREMTLSCKETK